MSLDMKFLRSRGISSGDYKPIFSAKREDQPKKIQKLIDIISDDIRTSRTINFKEWRAYRAIDLAFDTPFNQNTPTILQSIAGRNLSPDAIKTELKAWGLSEDTLLNKVPVEGTPNAFKYEVNLPVLFKILIPLVKAYTMQATARIFNELNTSPFLPYTPLKETDRNRVACEIITDIVNTQSVWYGYPASVRQAILQTMKYGMALGFPMEEWHCQEQVRGNGTKNGERFVEKEGLRYRIPDPTRTGYDLAHSLNTLNSDTGCEWVLDWDVCRYGDILDNPKFWNRTKIFGGQNWFAEGVSGNYFTEFFPCTEQMPDRWLNMGESLKRIDKMAFYGASDRQRAVFTTNYYRKLIPANWGLGRYENGKLVSTYHHPVWHRFKVASDDTIIWAEPSAYCPAFFMGYDYDEQAASTSSYALDVVPFQDQLTNILSQMVLTALQNLDRVVFYDTALVKVTDVKSLKNLGESRYRSTKWIGFDSMLNQRSGLNQIQAFQVPNFGHVSIGEMMNLVPLLLNMLDRILQASAQDSGSAASHYQGKEELLQTGAASSNRRLFTSGYIYDGLDAMQRQMYEGNRAYRDDEVVAQVSAETPNLDAILAELEYKVTERGNDKVMVKGSKKSLRLEGFAARFLGPQPSKEKELAQVIMQTVQTISGQPELAQAVGTKTILRMVEMAMRLAGGPKDVRFQVQPGKQNGQIDPNVVNALKQVQTNILQHVGENVSKPAAKAVGQVQQQVAQIEEVIKRMEPIFKQAATFTDKTAVAQRESEAKMQRDTAAFQAEEARKQQKHDLEMRRMVEESQVEITLDKEKTAAEIQVADAKARASSPKAET